MDPMTISMIISLLVYLMSPKDNSAQRRQAVLNAAVAGLGTYYVTTQTEWGRELIGAETTAADANPQTVGQTGIAQPPLTGTVGAPGAVVQSGVPLSSTLASYAPYAAAAAVGTVAVSTLAKYVPLALGLIAGYFGLRALTADKKGNA